MPASLFVPEIDTNIVKRKWIPEAARSIADEYDDDTTITRQDFDEAVDNECNEHYGVYACEGLTLIAAYGWSDAVKGGVDYEDSPIELFKQDVAEVAEMYLLDKGIEIID